MRHYFLVVQVKAQSNKIKPVDKIPQKTFIASKSVAFLLGSLNLKECLLVTPLYLFYFFYKIKAQKIIGN